jgi:hypothetical protein
MIVYYAGFLIHFVSIEDILAAKTVAKRDKDRETLPELLDNQEQDQKARNVLFQSPYEFEVFDTLHLDLDL